MEQERLRAEADPFYSPFADPATAEGPISTTTNQAVSEIPGTGNPPLTTGNTHRDDSIDPAFITAWGTFTSTNQDWLISRGMPGGNILNASREKIFEVIDEFHRTHWMGGMEVPNPAAPTEVSVSIAPNIASRPTSVGEVLAGREQTRFEAHLPHNGDVPVDLRFQNWYNRYAAQRFENYGECLGPFQELEEDTRDDVLLRYAIDKDFGDA